MPPIGERDLVPAAGQPAREWSSESIPSRLDDSYRVQPRDVAILAGLAAWVVASRLPYVHDFAYMGKDGPLYVHSLSFGRDYDVPMPGNIGFVALAKAATLFWSRPTDAYAAVTIALTVVAATFTYLIGKIAMPRSVAAAATFALVSNSIVWFHGVVITSYLVWLAVLPAVGWFGLRFRHAHRRIDLILSSLALGLGTALRPDLIAFGTPLWSGCLLLGKARLRDWLCGVAIVAACCASWLLLTAWVLGGVDVYLGRVFAKHTGDLDGFSLARRGLVEGLARNGSKYALFLLWSSHLVVAAAVLGIAFAVRRFRTMPQALLLSILWVGPSWAFSFLVFTGNAGLIFPLLPLLYLGAAWGLTTLIARRRESARTSMAYLRPGGARGAAVALTALGLLSTAQFTAVPLLPEVDQRAVILNVTFLHYGAAGLRDRHNFNLDDYGINPALKSVVRQMRHPEATPRIPPSNFEPSEPERRRLVRASGLDSDDRGTQ